MRCRGVAQTDKGKQLDQGQSTVGVSLLAMLAVAGVLASIALTSAAGSESNFALPDLREGRDRDQPRAARTASTPPRQAEPLADLAPTPVDAQAPETVAIRREVHALLRPLLQELDATTLFVETDREAIGCVLADRAELALTGTPISSLERNRGGESSQFGAFVATLAVPRGHVVHGITAEAANGLVAGSIRNWSEVGGPDEEIVLMGLEAGPIAGLLRELLLDGDRIAVAEAFRSFDALAAGFGTASPRTHVALLPLPRIPRGAHQLTVGSRRARDDSWGPRDWHWVLPLHAVARNNRAGHRRLDSVFYALDDLETYQRLSKNLLLVPPANSPSPR